ncbi:MAG TPA: histidine phosphatase family protein [Sneathiellales bacterium]|jgi:alpha-ribazole phosphatase|nr:histidine phosphatase family protein [Sneathiellales bacterium]
MSQITRWHFVRHAPVVNSDGEAAFYKSNDEPSDVSDTEAFKGLARHLPKDAVWLRSHLQRTKQTADAIRAAGLDFPEPIIDPDLAEQDFGDWHGRSRQELEQEIDDLEPHKFWIIPAEYEPPGGESFVTVMARVERAIQRHTAAHQGKTIVAVCHGGVINAAIGLALGLNSDQSLMFSVANLSTTRLDRLHGPGLGGDWRMVFHNMRAR